MRATLLAITVLAALAQVALAQQDTPTQGESGSINVGRSRVYVFIGKKGRFGHEHGAVGRVKSGKITLGAAKDAGELVFDMASFSADTKEARKYVSLGGEVDDSTRQQVTDTMLGPTVLDAKAHPTAKFVIATAQPVKTAQPMKASKPDDPVKYQLDGQFTLRGTTKPLSVVAQVHEVDGEKRLWGKFTILQTDYGIRPYSQGLGIVGVSDQLTIWGDIFVKQ